MSQSLNLYNFICHKFILIFSELTMASELKKEKSFREKLGTKFRLVLLNDETLSEVRSFRLTLQTIYIALSTLVLLISLLIVGLFVFTPIKRFLPGYADIKGNVEFVKLKNQVSEMEEIIDAQTVYIDGLTNMVTGGEVSSSIEEGLDAVELPSEDRVVPAEPTAPRIGAYYLMAPLKGELVSGFLDRKNHLGVDIVAPKNSPIKATKDGIVISSDWSFETGHSITLQHQSNLISIYKHNSKLLKKNGDKVLQGESIAIIGNTGELTSGPHLHFELWFDGNPIDPEQYIDFKK